jgi:hypothetical protein
MYDNHMVIDTHVTKIAIKLECVKVD